jgi:hypothetical protein
VWEALAVRALRVRRAQGPERGVRRVDVGRWRASGRRRQCASRMNVREQS